VGEIPDQVRDDRSCSKEAILDRSDPRRFVQGDSQACESINYSETSSSAEKNGPKIAPPDRVTVERGDCRNPVERGGNLVQERPLRNLFHIGSEAFPPASGITSICTC
jgi:hypothetical protein